MEERGDAHCGSRQMSGVKQFRKGDAVVHPEKPEWGEGVVDQATTIEHEGKTAQRLVVRFNHRGRIAINTGVAPLAPKTDKEVVTMSSTRTSTVQSETGSDKGWLASLEGRSGEHELHQLGDALTDPFSSLSARLKATLDSYSYSTEARSLIEWAIAQTRLPDPMTKYTRQELEQGFQRFARDRDRYLVELVRQIKHEGQGALLQQAQSTAAGEAQSALQRAIRA